MSKAFEYKDEPSIFDTKEYQTFCAHFIAAVSKRKRGSTQRQIKGELRKKFSNRVIDRFFSHAVDELLQTDKIKNIGGIERSVYVLGAGNFETMKTKSAYQRNEEFGLKTFPGKRKTPTPDYVFEKVR